MPDVAYRGIKDDLVNGAVDWNAGTAVFRMLLLEVRSTTPGADEDKDLQFLSALLGVTGVAEFTGTNYSRQTLANPTTTYDAATDRYLLDANDVVFANLGVADGTDGTVRAAVVYRRVGADDSTPADDPLYCLLDVNDTVTNGQNFTVALNSAGLLALA
jgi:hypothetical protein